MLLRSCSRISESSRGLATRLVKTVRHSTRTGWLRPLTSFSWAGLPKTCFEPSWLSDDISPCLLGLLPMVEPSEFTCWHRYRVIDQLPYANSDAPVRPRHHLPVKVRWSASDLRKGGVWPYDYR